MDLPGGVPKPAAVAAAMRNHRHRANMPVAQLLTGRSRADGGGQPERRLWLGAARRPMAARSLAMSTADVSDSQDYAVHARKRACGADQ